MDIALLSTRITIQKNTVLTDEVGNHTDSWSDFFSAYATISGESGSEGEKAGEVVTEARCAFTVRWSSETAAVTTDGYRILWNGSAWNITSIDHQNNKRKTLKFWCEKERN